MALISPRSLFRLVIGLAALAIATVLFTQSAHAAPTWIDDRAGMIDDQVETAVAEQIKQLHATHNVGMYVNTWDVECADLNALVEERMFLDDSMNSGTREDIFIGLSPGCPKAAVTFFVADNEPIFDPVFTDPNTGAGPFADVDDVSVYLVGVLDAVQRQAAANTPAAPAEEPAASTQPPDMEPPVTTDPGQTQPSGQPAQPSDDHDAKGLTLNGRSIGIGVGIAAALGLMIGGLMTSRQKSKHSTAVLRSTASTYERPDSLQVTQSQDVVVSSETTHEALESTTT